MALVPVAHKPVTGNARQFDGTLAALTDIMSGRSNANVTVTCTFDATGAFVGLSVSGGAYGSFSVKKDDWVVFPTDVNLKPIAVPAAEANNEWTVV